MISNNESETIPSTFISNQIKGKSYKFVAEVDYEKTWNNSRFTSGIKYSGSWSDSEYIKICQESHTHWDNIYAFGEYWRRLGDKIDLTVGAGAVYNKNITMELINSKFSINFLLCQYPLLNREFKNKIKERKIL